MAIIKCLKFSSRKETAFPSVVVGILFFLVAVYDPETPTGQERVTTQTDT
jgi:hypothetical protein